MVLGELAALLVAHDEITALLTRAVRLGGRLVPAANRWSIYAVGSGGKTTLLLDLTDDRTPKATGAVAPRGAGTLGFGAAVDRQVLVKRQMALVSQPVPSPTEGATARSAPPVHPKTAGACIPLVSAGGVMTGALVVMARKGITFTETDLALLRTVSHHLTVLLSLQAGPSMPSQAAPQPSTADERDEYISLTAHELRSPLTSVKGYAQLLLRGARKDPDYPEHNLRALLAIEQQASRMSDMVAEMLDASRIQRGAFEIHLRPTDMYTLARRVVELRRPGLERHDLRFETDLADLVGRWDAQRVEQVIRDLVDNAIRFSPNGGVVTVRLTRADNVARLCVEDEGVGVDAEDRERIFEPFYRSATAQRRNLSGLGLGLFVSRTIAEALGGRLWLQPADPAHHGSVFCLELPLDV